MTNASDIQHLLDDADAEAESRDPHALAGQRGRISRCHHRRSVLADLWTTTSSDIYCLADWTEIESCIRALGPAGRGHGSGAEDWLRSWSGAPDPDLLVECECACDCTSVIRFVNADTEGLVLRCPHCVAANHEPWLSARYLAWPAGRG